MRHSIKGMQGELVARRDRLDERRPVSLQHLWLQFSIEHVAQSGRRVLQRLRSGGRRLRHWRNCTKLCRPIKITMQEALYVAPQLSDEHKGRLLLISRHVARAGCGTMRQSRTCNA